MPSLSCPDPWWKDGYVSPCLRDTYFALVIPVAAAALSLSLLCLAQVYRRRRRGPFFRGHDGTDPSTVDNGSGRELTQSCGPSRRMQAAESVAIAVDIAGVSAILLWDSSSGPYGSLWLAAYLFALSLATRFNNTQVPSSGVHLQNLYLVQWVCIFVVAHETILTSADTFTRLTTLLRLGLYTGLLFLRWTTPRSVPPPPSFDDTNNGDTPFPRSPDQTASPLSWLLFSWVDSLLWKAFRAGTLQGADMFRLNPRLASDRVATTRRDREEKKKTSPSPPVSLLRRIFQAAAADLVRQAAWVAVRSVLVFVPPFLIKLILECLEQPDDLVASRNARVYVFGLLASSLVAGIADCHCDWVGTQITAKARVILLDQIYAKVLRRRIVRSSSSSPSSDTPQQPGLATNGSEQHTADGAIYNFVSGDVQFISSMAGMTYLVSVIFPVQIAVGTALLYQILGASGVLGVVSMVLLIPLNVLLSRRLARIQARVLVAGDARIQASNELLHAYRTIKYYAWEAPFRERVLAARRAEMKLMRSRFIWWSISMTLFFSLPFIVTIITCFFYTVVWGHELGISVAFPALATFSVIKIPLNRLADSITFFIQAYVSLTRIDQFLNEPETEKTAQLSTADSSSFGFEDASFTWPKSDVHGSSDEETPLLATEDTPSPASFRLQNLTIKFSTTGLNVICGPSGAGKSSLLLALLGETHLDKGRVSLPHQSPPAAASEQNYHDTAAAAGRDATAYCPHEPWILNQSIRANILLGHPFDASRYEAVLRAVALDADTGAMRDGDRTPAGENGNKLSGGQKQRVALARALYSPCRRVLLDDCLSALDARTARHVFARGIRGPLMRGRACVLATHHVRLAVPQAELVVVLEGGRVKAVGGPEDLISRGVVDVQAAKGKLVDDDNKEGVSDIGDSQQPPSPVQDSVAQEGGAAKPKPDATSEDKAEGAVSWAVVAGYLKAMGPRGFWVLVMIGFAAQQIAALGTNLWIREWAFQYDKVTDSPDSQYRRASGKDVSAWYYLTIYTSLCLAYALITFFRDLVTFSGSIKASSNTYERLLDAVLSAKLSFFDRPLGQITNRFSKDVSVVDQSLASFSVSALQIATTVAMVIILMLSVLPGGIFLVLVLGAIFAAYYLVTAVYIRGAQDLKRIEAIARSPLYQHVGESIAGYVSIRAYGREAAFTTANGRLVDGVNQPFLLLEAAEQWLKIRVDVLSSIITLVAGVFVVWGGTRSATDPGAAGLVLTYAVNFTENMLWLVTVYAIIQQNLTSVERINEYVSAEQESRGAAPGRVLSRVPEAWPTRGGVAFRHFTARYAPHLAPVLRGVNFSVRPGERVAVVGRTGAGKSSLALALLRVLEAGAGDDDEDDDDGGRIEIDGVDIATVELGRLRGAAVTMIPQDPQLFGGSVRANLDPLGRHTDQEMRDVLRSVQAPVRNQDGWDLLHVSDLERDASELSRGQCQLLCLARGLLRKSRVLILDEATANVDHAADAAIQAGLRASVKETGATVITVAHRLLTIVDYDRVVILDAGRVVEQGSVRELLARDGNKAVFRRFCEQSGEWEAIERATRL